LLIAVLIVQSALFLNDSAMNLSNKKLLKGIGFMLCGMSVVPFLDVFAKILSEDYPVMQVTWTRFFFHAFWLLPVILWQKIRWWKMPENPGLQALRGLMLTLGVIVVLQPESEQFKPSLLYAVIAGVAYALYIIITKKLTFRAPPILTLFYSALVGIIIMTPLAISSWVTPDLKGLLMGAAMGFVAAASHFMIIKAFEFASASELSPFNYFEIVVAIILSYLVFDFVPNFMAILGLIIIIGSGLFVSWRAMKNNQIQDKQVDAVIEPL